MNRDDHDVRSEHDELPIYLIGMERKDEHGYVWRCVRPTFREPGTPGPWIPAAHGGNDEAC